MSTLDLYGTECDGNGVCQSYAWGEAGYQNLDSGRHETDTAAVEAVQRPLEGPAPASADADEERRVSDAVGNCRRAAKAVMRHCIDAMLLLTMLTGVVIACGSWGSALLDCVMMLAGVCVTLGAAAVAGLYHDKCGW